jgi:hypothetical protein
MMRTNEDLVPPCVHCCILLSMYVGLCYVRYVYHDIATTMPLWVIVMYVS